MCPQQSTRRETLSSTWMRIWTKLSWVFCLWVKRMVQWKCGRGTCVLAMTVCLLHHMEARLLSCPPHLVQNCCPGITFYHPPRDSLFIFFIGSPAPPSPVFHFLDCPSCFEEM